VLEHPENIEELKAITALLRRARGLMIAFVKVNHPTLLARVIAAIRASLPGLRIGEVRLSPQPAITIPSQIENALHAAEIDALFVYDLVRMFDWSSEDSPAISNLNLNRNYLGQQVPFPTIFFLPEHALGLIGRLAPDFWSWRSGVFDLVAEGDDAATTLNQLTDQEWKLSVAERMEREQLLKSIASELKQIQPRQGHSEARVNRAIAASVLLDGDADTAQAHLAVARSLFKEARDEESLALTMWLEGEAYRMLGAFDEAEQSYTAAQRFFQSVGNTGLTAYSIRGLADVHLGRGDYAQASRAYSQAEQMHRTVGDLRGVAHCNEGTADLLRLQSRFEEAIAQYETARNLYTEIDDRRNQAYCDWSLGEIALEKAQLDPAERLLKRAAKAYGLVADRRGAAHCLEALAEIELRKNNFALAQAKFEEARTAHQQIGNRIGEATCLRGLGKVALSLRAYRQAEELFTTSKQIFEEIGDVRNRAISIENLADNMRKRDRFVPAERLYREAQRIYRSLSDLRNDAYCDWAIGEMARCQRDYARGRTLLMRAADHYGQLGHQLGVARAHLGLADVALRCGDLSKANEYYSSARTLFTSLGDRRGLGATLRGLAELAMVRDSFDKARLLLDEAFEEYEAIETQAGNEDSGQHRGDPTGSADCWHTRGELARREGKLDEAKEYYHSALSQYRYIESPAREAECLRSLSELYKQMKDDESARSVLAEAERISSFLRTDRAA
jgi:tetratricopeptide (TPR) repeat protein